MNRIAIIATNYNMPEATDAFWEYFQEHVDYPHDFIIVDNASDLIAPSKHTTVFLKENVQTCGGWLTGLEHADKMEQALGEPYFAYVIVGTSIELVPDSDHIRAMAEFLVENKDAVGIVPAIVDSKVPCWLQILDRGTGEPRRTWGIDHLFTMWRADWFNSVGRFDSDLPYAWGLAEETCWQARRDGKSIWVHEGIKMKKHHNIGYKMDRMNMTWEERSHNAMDDVVRVMNKKHGTDWMKKLSQEFVIDEWK